MIILDVETDSRSARNDSNLPIPMLENNLGSRFAGILGV
jgi:hypothetical protein